MIRVVHPGSGSRIQGSKRHRIPDLGSGSETLIAPQDAIHLGEDGILYLLCLLPLDLCGAMSDGDLHSAGYGQARRGAGAAHQGEDVILNLFCFLPLDLCGEVPDGDLHPAGYGQAGRGAGAAHQGEDDILNFL
jgi:hypothetical protein